MDLGTPDLIYMGVAIVLTSILSGVFGSSGGTLLLGALLVRLDVSMAMMVYSASQISSNVWRTTLWFRHVDWMIFLKLTAGSLVTTGLFSMISFVPNKAVIYLGLGAMPFLIGLLPKQLIPDIRKPGAPYLCGMLVMALMIMAGASGGILDHFFQKSETPRKTVVATKAAAQVITIIIRFFFFGALSALMSNTVPVEYLFGAVICSLIGILASSVILHRMSDAQFRRYTGYVLSGLGVTFFGRGLWLLVR